MTYLTPGRMVITLKAWVDFLPGHEVSAITILDWPYIYSRGSCPKISIGIMSWISSPLLISIWASTSNWTSLLFLSWLLGAAAAAAGRALGCRRHGISLWHTYKDIIRISPGCSRSCSQSCQQKTVFLPVGGIPIALLPADSVLLQAARQDFLHLEEGKSRYQIIVRNGPGQV